MGHVAYRIPDDIHRRAKALASYQGITFRQWLIAVIEAAVEAQEAKRDR